MIDVMLVDDHDLVRSGIKHILAQASGIRVTHEAASGEEALKIAREHHVDVILMDVKMPGIGGMEATRKLLRADPDLKILVVTICTNEVFPSRLL